jgi:hypothetical protein
MGDALPDHPIWQQAVQRLDLTSATLPCPALQPLPRSPGFDNACPGDPFGGGLGLS